MTRNEIIKRISDLSEDLDKRVKEKDELARYYGEKLQYEDAARCKNWGMGLWDAMQEVKKLLRDIDETDEAMAKEIADTEDAQRQVHRDTLKAMSGSFPGAVCGVRGPK